MAYLTYLNDQPINSGRVTGSEQEDGDRYITLDNQGRSYLEELTTGNRGTDVTSHASKSSFESSSDGDGGYGTYSVGRSMHSSTSSNRVIYGLYQASDAEIPVRTLTSAVVGTNTYYNETIAQPLAPFLIRIPTQANGGSSSIYRLYIFADVSRNSYGSTYSSQGCCPTYRYYSGYSGGYAPMFLKITLLDGTDVVGTNKCFHGGSMTIYRTNITSTHTSSDSGVIEAVFGNNIPKQKSVIVGTTGQICLKFNLGSNYVQSDQNILIEPIPVTPAGLAPYSAYKPYESYSTMAGYIGEWFFGDIVTMGMLGGSNGSTFEVVFPFDGANRVFKGSGRTYNWVSNAASYVCIRSNGTYCGGSSANSMATMASAFSSGTIMGTNESSVAVRFNFKTNQGTSVCGPAGVVFRNLSCKIT